MNIIWNLLKGLFWTFNCLAVVVGLAWIILKIFPYDPSAPNYTIQIIDGCQYLRMYDHEILTHKGDCNNPIHPRE